MLDLLIPIIRSLILLGLGWLVNHGVISKDQETTFATYYTEPARLVEIAGIVLTIAWAVRDKFFTRKKLMAALATPSPTSEADVMAMVKDGAAPSVLTPKTQVPVPKPVTSPNEPKE